MLMNADCNVVYREFAPKTALQEEVLIENSDLATTINSIFLPVFLPKVSAR